MLPPEHAEAATPSSDLPDTGPAWCARYVPALLSAFLPGLGQLMRGRRRLALLFAAPVVLLIVWGLLLAAVTPPTVLAAQLLDPTSIWVLLGLQAALFMWRLAAIGQNLFDPRLPRLHARDVVPIALLAILVVAPQAYAGYLTNAVRETGQSVEDTSTIGAWHSSRSPAPDPGDFETGAPEPSPSPSPSSSPRVNVLLIGVDSGVGRHTYLTDTLIVASLDPITNTVSMVSIPRDTVDVPLPDGRRFKQKINSLLAFAGAHPEQFPGSEGQGVDVLMSALGTLLGLQIDRYALVDLQGLVRVVNTLGGIDVTVAHAFCDPSYHEYGFTQGFAIRAGRHHLNGNQALAYARVRKASGESDFTRAARQQEVLSGLRDAIARGRFLRDPIGLLDALRMTVVTNVPPQMLPHLAEIMAVIGRDRTYRAVIAHPLVRPGFDVRGSIQIPDLAAIRTFSAQIFPQSGTLPSPTLLAPPAAGGGGGSGVSNCLPAPKPTPMPTPSPTPTPTPTSTATSTGPTPTPTPTTP